MNTQNSSGMFGGKNRGVIGGGGDNDQDMTHDGYVYNDDEDDHGYEGYELQEMSEFVKTDRDLDLNQIDIEDFMVKLKVPKNPS